MKYGKMYTYNYSNVGNNLPFSIHVDMHDKLFFTHYSLDV